MSACAALAALAAACDPTPSPLELQLRGDEVAVHSILVANADSATVIITKLVREMIYQNHYRFAPVALEGARVELIHGTDTLQLSPGANCTRTFDGSSLDSIMWRGGCYVAAVPGGIMAGRTYHLRAVLPSRGEVRGSAIVPAPPTIIAPATGAVVSVRKYGGRPEDLDSLRVQWSQERAGTSEVTIAVSRECHIGLYDPTARSGDGEFAAAIRTSGTELRLYPFSVWCNPPPVDRLAGRVLVSRYDANAAEYRRNAYAERLPEMTAAFGLTGAHGVFGAVASAERPIELVIRD